MDTSLSAETPQLSEWEAAKKAIAEYLRHEYASQKFGIENDPLPMKLSTYSGKGVGHYETSGDGRADWSPEFKRYIFKSTERVPEQGELRFAFEEVDAAMRQLQLERERWYDILYAIDVEARTYGEVAEIYKRDVSTIGKLRSKAIRFIYTALVLNPKHPVPTHRKAPVKVRMVTIE